MILGGGGGPRDNVRAGGMKRLCGGPMADVWVQYSKRPHLSVLVSRGRADFFRSTDRWDQALWSPVVSGLGRGGCVAT
jgi:hypothetical protein